MTLRAAFTGAVAAGMLLAGWRLGWPELTALGGAALCLVVVTVALSGRRPVARVTTPQVPLRVTRGAPASSRVVLNARSRRRWMRLTDGKVTNPTHTIDIPSKPRGESLTLVVPLDTSRRGAHLAGPYTVVHGDPWSMTRRVLATTPEVGFTVLPRTYDVPRSLLLGTSIEETMYVSRRAGDHHFHALRDYVLGDEPRMVHWRSSARVGHLVVRQQVAAATTGTTVVLDCDRTAYSTDEQFGSGWLDDRFEAAVEVAASVVATDLGHNENIELALTLRDKPPVRAVAGSPLPCLEALAMVQAVAPTESEPGRLPMLIRRSRSARMVLVTGSARPATLDAARRIQRAGVRVVVMRVGARDRRSLPGLCVIDVEQPTDLATCRL